MYEYFVRLKVSNVFLVGEQTDGNSEFSDSVNLSLFTRVSRSTS